MQLEASLEASEERVWHVSWSSDGEHVASCGEDRIIRIWESQQWTCICTLEEGTQSRTLRCCEWSPSNKKLATASFCGIVAIWETQTTKRNVWDQVASLEGHENEVKAVAWSYDGRYLASCGRDKKIWLWEDMDSQGVECVCILDGHTQDVKFVVWHRSEHFLFSASYDDTIKLWADDDGDWYCVDTLLGHSSTVWGLSLNAAGDKLVSCSDDLSLICWTSSGGTWTQSHMFSQAHSQPIYSLDWSHLDGCVATGGGDNSIRLFATADGSLLPLATQTEAHEGDVNCVR